MFYFYTTEQTHSNVSFHKGVLFEDLLRRYLQAAGYDVRLTRRKKASAEYDIDGRHTVDGRSVVGEAKAHNDTISLQDVSAFVGKALPFLHPPGPYAALFLSTTSLSPEADDYIENLERTTPYRIARLCGVELERHIRSLLQLPSVEHAAAATRAVIPAHSNQHLLHTDLGTFVVVVGAGEEGAFDDRFALVSKTGALVSDPVIHLGLKEHTQAFQELEPVRGSATPTDLSPIQSRHIPQGLITANDWFDYRRPAGTHFFVGRDEPLARAQASLDASGTGAVIEVKSRSGVGKSSLLAVLAVTRAAAGDRVELHDARDVRSASDVMRLVQRFTQATPRLRTFEDVPGALEQLHAGLGQGHAIFLVDQFESTFLAPEVYYAYEYIALCIARGPRQVAMIYSRKDDLLTTHDEIVVSLERLRGISQSISLDDFSRDEASLLINRMAQIIPQRLSERIRSQVLGFAQGFPWLIKRTMAHVAGMIGRGVSQQELLSTGLHLEDLFEEEIAELDEHERGYLTRLATVLPATYQFLSRRFEDDPFLRQMLEKLTHRKLLRLSAGTYDTYNDVLKDFLLYERLPERSQSQMFRLGLVPVMRCFRALGGTSRIDPETFAESLGKSLTSTYNVLRELRLAGLVARTASGWVVPDVVRGYEHADRLGEYVRQSALKNRVVSELLVEVEKTGGLPKDRVEAVLRHHFPFVEAKDEVWGAYASTLVDWLHRLKLVHLTEEHLLVPMHEDKEKILRQLGNLYLTGRGVRPSDAAFVPSAPYRVCLRVLHMAHAGTLPIKLPTLQSVARDDLRRFGALRETATGGFSPAQTPEEFEAAARELLGAEPYLSYWDLLERGDTYASALAKAFGLTRLAPSTRHWLGGRLANWGRQLGYLPQRGAVRKDKGQGDLFEASTTDKCDEPVA